MRIYLTTAYNQGVALRFLRTAAASDRFGVHEIVRQPESADAILFVENAEPEDPFYRRLLRHPLVRESGHRVFMYNEFDLPYCALPGLYVSMPRSSFDETRQLAFPYLFRPNEFVSEVYGQLTPRDLLFSFMGARNHRIRRRLIAMTHPRAQLEDTSSFSIWFSKDPSEMTTRKRLYADLLARSKFVLCPRGAGTSSYRLFEAMEAGRAPVVISDRWKEPTGPDWSSFLVRIAEADVQRIPDVLKELESQAGDRGRAARAAWEEWFAPDSIFHHAVEGIATLMEKDPQRPSWRMRLHELQIVRSRASQALRRSAIASWRFVDELRR
jgi:hypothetical protein